MGRIFPLENSIRCKIDCRFRVTIIPQALHFVKSLNAFAIAKFLTVSKTQGIIKYRNLRKELFEMDAVNQLKKYFPFKATQGNVMSLVIAIVVYVVVGVIAGVIMGVIGIIPLVDIIVRILGVLVDLYCLAGIVLAVLDFLGILK